MLVGACARRAKSGLFLCLAYFDSASRAGDGEGAPDVRGQDASCPAPVDSLRVSGACRAHLRLSQSDPPRCLHGGSTPGGFPRIRQKDRRIECEAHHDVFFR